MVKSLSPGAVGWQPAAEGLPRSPAGMLNSVGLQNPGVEAWLDDELPALAATGARVVASIWGFTADDYGRAAEALAAAGRAGPGRSSRSRPTSAARTWRTAGACSPTPAPASTAAVAAAADGLQGSGLPLWAKLSPNVTDLTAIAGAALDAGAEA